MPYTKEDQAAYDVSYRQFNKERLSEQAKERMRKLRLLRKEKKRNTLRNTNAETEIGKAGLSEAKP